jgi:hypothetical protein
MISCKQVGRLEELSTKFKEGVLSAARVFKWEKNNSLLLNCMNVMCYAGNDFALRVGKLDK